MWSVAVNQCNFYKYIYFYYYFPSSSRYAFVEFENVEDSKEALENCNNTDIEGRSIRLEFSQNDRERGGGGRGNSGMLNSALLTGGKMQWCTCITVFVTIN